MGDERGAHGEHAQHSEWPEVVALTVTTTTDSAERAGALAAGAVERKVAACAQVSPPLVSYYRWQGEVQQEREWMVVFKTTPARYQALEDYVRWAHDYDTPEIVATPVVRGSAAYLAWVAKETSV